MGINSISVIFCLLGCVLVPSLVSGQCLLAVNITMRDGIDLYTCIDFPFLPSSELKNLSLVIDRSPYGSWGTELIADIFLLENFVAVRQDMRGTHLSGGDFTLWADAANDSYDTMKYLAQQEWASGDMFAVGASADGLAVFADPKESPPWLKAAMIIFSSDQGYSIIFPGGAYRLSLTEFWLRKTIPNQYTELIKEVKANEAPSSWWDRLNSTTGYGHVTYPTVMWAGWYDIFLAGALEGFQLYQYRSPSRGKHKLVIDPLGHCQAGAKYFLNHTILGRAALPILLGLDLFKPTGKIPENVKEITFYVMGSHAWEESDKPGGYWTSLQEFPTFIPTNYYLHDGGLLSSSLPTSSSSSLSYKYDPAHPVPSTGGNNLEVACGPLDQRSVEDRSDVLLFTSSPLTKPLALTGPLTATLYVSSDAVDTDFTVKLTDVYPSGESSLIQDGIIRMRWRELSIGGVTPILMIPHSIYRVDLTLWNTSFIFNTNHSIRVAVSSSNSPRFAPNANTGKPLNSTDTENVTAFNTVYFNSVSPSHITLPVLEDYTTQLPPTFVFATEPAMKFLEDKSPEYQIKFWETTKAFEDRLQHELQMPPMQGIQIN